jgi:hypothetical protein
MYDELPDFGEQWDTEDKHYVEKKWEVILRFTPENQLEDVCYLLKIPKCTNKKED